MSSFASEPTPLDIEDVQHLRETAGEIRLRVSGRWRGDSPPSDADSALLVIQIEGRRHRFAPVSDTDPPASTVPGRWTASFVVPGWAEPRREGQAALWIGEAVVPIPPIGASRRWPGSGPPALGAAVPAGPADVTPAVAAVPSPPVFAAAPPPAQKWRPAEPGSEPGRAGPLADMLLKETIAALHGELEARAVETTRLRSELAGAHSELAARTGSHGELEGTLGELGAELQRLTAAVAEQRLELDRHEADGAREREESERRLAELSAIRDDQAAELAALREELASAREELDGVRNRHAAELASTREGHAAELAALREQHASSTGAEREQAAAEREQAAAELRELRAQLAAVQDSAQRRTGENSGLREELAAAQVAREAAYSEVAGLRAELERLGGELAVTRERIQGESGDLGEANRLLADARALAAQLRAQPAGS